MQEELGSNERKKSVKNTNAYANFLIFACAFLYCSSMAAKGIFVAEQKYIVDLWSLQYAEASSANTYYFVLYGITQIVLFLIMQKLNIFKYLLFTVPLAALATMLMGTAKDMDSICLFFGLSGLFQAGIYCGCNHFLTKYLPATFLTKANKIMNAMYAIGTVSAYAVCAFFITWNFWRLPYFLFGGIFFLSIAVFAVAVRKCKRIEIAQQFDVDSGSTKASKKSQQPFLLVGKKNKKLFYLFVIIFAIFISALYYGVMNYITALLVDVHGFSQNSSIYVSIIAPIAITFGPMLTISSCEKNQDFVTIGFWYLLLALPIPLLLVWFYKSHVLVALALCLMFIVLAQGVKAIVLSVIPFQMREQINVGGYSAIVNAVISISGGVTPMIVGKLIDLWGWGTAYGVIFVLTMGTVIGVFLVRVFFDYLKIPHLK